jgi:hypothetical protein
LECGQARLGDIVGANESAPLGDRSAVARPIPLAAPVTKMHFRRAS